MVTGEFYGRVTIRWVTTAPARPKLLRDKRPACRWLRSSSYNFPDQRDAVMKSLSKNLVFSTTPNAARNGAHERTPGPKVSTQPPEPAKLVCWELLLISKVCPTGRNWACSWDRHPSPHPRTYGCRSQPDGDRVVLPGVHPDPVQQSPFDGIRGAYTPHAAGPSPTTRTRGNATIWLVYCSLMGRRRWARRPAGRRSGRGDV